MSFDILGYYNKHRDFYGDVPLDEVGKDLFSRGGYDKKFPDYNEFTKAAGIDQVIQEDARRRNPPSFMDKLREGVASVAPGLEEIAKGLEAGVQQVKGMGHGLTALAGTMMGSEALVKRGAEGLRDVEAKTPKPAVGSISEIGGLSDVGKYLAYGVTSNLPNMLVSLATGGAGGLIGKKIATKAAEKILQTAGMSAIEKKAAQEAGKQVVRKAITRGAVTGAATASIGMEAGMIAGDQLTETGEVHPLKTLAGAVPAGLLDVVPEWYLAKKLGWIGKGASEFTGGRMTRIAKVAGSQFAVEAPTEAMQSVIERASVPGKSLTNADAWDEYINSFILGGMTGAVVGGAGGIFTKKADELTPEQAEYIDRMKKGAVLTTAIHSGMSTGKLGEDPFTPDDALKIIKEGRKYGIYTEDDVERFGDRYPALKLGLNEVKVEDVKEKINKAVKAEGEIPYPGYREVGKDEILQPGADVKMDMATGKNYVKDKVNDTIDRLRNRANELSKEGDRTSEEKAQLESFRNKIDEAQFAGQQEPTINQIKVDVSKIPPDRINDIYLKIKDLYDQGGEIDTSGYTTDAPESTKRNIIKGFADANETDTELIQEVFGTIGAESRAIAGPAPVELPQNINVQDMKALDQIFTGIADQKKGDNESLLGRAINNGIESLDSKDQNGLFTALFINYKPELHEAYVRTWKANAENRTNVPRETAKEPWEMTRAEWDASMKEAPATEAYDHFHPDEMRRNVIKQALAEGKTVPPEVLKDYPELGKKEEPGTPLAKTEEGKAIEAARKNYDDTVAHLKEKGYRVAKRILKSEKTEARLYAMGFRPYLLKDGNLTNNILGVWAKEPKPKKSLLSTGPPPGGWTEADKVPEKYRKPTEPSIGKNSEGEDIYEDKNGIRYIVENKIRVTEPVLMVPTRGGVVSQAKTPREARYEVEAKSEESTAGEYKTLTKKGSGSIRYKFSEDVPGRLVVDDIKVIEKRKGEGTKILESVLNRAEDNITSIQPSGNGFTDEGMGFFKNFGKKHGIKIIDVTSPSYVEERPYKAPTPQVGREEPTTYKEGDRVVVGEKHGAISKADTIVMRPIFGAGGESRIYSYTVKYDSGREAPVSGDQIKRETEKPTEPEIPDIMADLFGAGSPRLNDPAAVVDSIQHSEKKAKEYRAAAGRTRTDKNRYAILQKAADEEKIAAQLQKAFDEWAAKYPEAAEKYRPVKKTAGAPAPVSPTITGDLSDYGMSVTESTTNKGTPVWNVSGNTREHMDTIKRLGGRWYGPKKVWSFYDGDPTAKILEALGGKKATTPEAAEKSAPAEAAKPTGLTLEMLERAWKSGDARGDALTAVKTAIESLKNGDIEGARLMAAKAQGFTGTDLGFGDAIKKPAPAPYGSENKMFTEEKANKAREILRKKLGGIHMGVPLDPEVIQAGIDLAGYHIEAGARTFAAYSKRMIEDLGDVIRPYLKSFYMAVRNYPGFDKNGMNNEAEIDEIDVDTIDISEKKDIIESREGGDENASPGNEQRTETAARNDQGSNQGEGAEPVQRAEAGGEAGGVREGSRGRNDAELPGGEQQAPGQTGQRGEGVRGSEGLQPGRVPAVEGHPGDLARIPGGNYRISDGELTRTGSWKDAAKTNLDIIELVKRLDEEKRAATPEEKALLVKYVGWGSSELANKMFPGVARTGELHPDWERDESWRKLAERLESLLTPEQIKTAAKSTQYAHYTSEAVIRAIYKGLERIGFKGGRVLEPGMGIGHFAGLIPWKSTYTGIEMDSTTARIAQYLYPNHHIKSEDFTKTVLPDNFFDLSIGNPPFASITILSDPAYKKKRFKLHEYFIAKSLDKTKPGGLMVFISSRYAMDKVESKARDYIAERADLLGAIRLPQTAFKQNAGTEVVTDVMFFRKRLPGEQPGGQAWQSLKEIQTEEGPVNINEYFVDHPEMVLGKNSLTGSMYREKEYTVLPMEGNIEDHFAEAVTKLPEGSYDPSKLPADTTKKAVIERDMDPTNKKEGGLYLGKNGILMKTEFGTGVSLSDIKKLSPKDIAFLKDYIPLRDTLKQAQYDQLNDGEWEKSLKALNKAYNDFVKKHGRIQEHTVYEKIETDEDGNQQTIEYRRYKNVKLMMEDVENSLVWALETIDDNGDIKKSISLAGRTIKPPTKPEIKTASDALAVSLDQKGTLDLDYVASLIGESTENVIEQLGDLLFEDPVKGHILADEYLSGDVVKKLEEAKVAAATDKRFERNIKALEEAQPVPLSSGNITLNLGANWIPIDYYNDFLHEVIGVEGLEVFYRQSDNTWTIGQQKQDEGSYYNRRRAVKRQSLRSSKSDWGTPDRGANEILESVLNNKTIKIMRTEKIDGTTHTYLDQTATAAANDVAKKMREAFGGWIWQDAERADDLLSIYNRKFNNLAGRRFDGRHLTLPGFTSLFPPHDHQKRAIWRIIQSGNTYLAHAVGAGKTMEMIAAGMEMRRLGMITKPVYVVPKHMLQQFANEFQLFYPMAHVMIADEVNFHTENRRRFIAQAALNNPDAIVITHPSLVKLKMKAENVAPVRDAYLQDMRDTLAELEEDRQGNRIRIKQMEHRIEQAEQRFDAMISGEGKDSAVTFEEMGADFLFVDEAHNFRKLDFVTNRQAKGVDPIGSIRAMDLYIKTLYLDKKNPGRSHVFASGTPVVNTMGELYTLMKFFSEKKMDEEGMHHFDAWANMYGVVTPDYELNAAGRYEIVERFSKFVNIPELMSRVREFADVLTMSQLGQFVKRPAIKGGQPKIVIAHASQALRNYQENVLLPRIRHSKEWKPSPREPGNPDPIINIITDGRLASIDLRYVLPSTENDPNSKLNTFIDGIIQTYKDTKDMAFTDPETGKEEAIKGGTQIVFYNLGFGEQVAKNRGFDARAWTTKRLKEVNIPASHIAWIDDFKTAQQKEAIFKEMRQGKKRILIGSAKKMGTGVNVQRRLVDLHYLDAPWYPADVEQPDGRILRQGNLNTEVGLYRYATKGSYDATMWQMVSRKSKMTEQAWQGDKNVRSVEDFSESSQYAMASAMASGDERTIQLVGLQSEIIRLGRLKEAHSQQQMNLRQEKRERESNESFYRSRLVDLKSAQTKVPDHIRDIEGKIDGKTFDNREEFGQKIIDRMVALNEEMQKDQKTLKADAKLKIAELNGFPVSLVRAGISLFSEPMVSITDKVSEKFDANSESDPRGLVTKMVNFLNGIDDKISQMEDGIAANKRETEAIDKKIGAPFEYANDLAEKISEEARLKAELASEGEKTEISAEEAQRLLEEKEAKEKGGQAAPETQKYYAYIKNEYHEVDGQPVENDFGIDLFVWRDDDGEWIVNERITGWRIKGGETKKAAIETSLAAIEERGVEATKDLINKAVEKDSSPWAKATGKLRYELAGEAPKEQYSVSAKGAPWSLKEVQEIFKGQEVIQTSPNGLIYIKTNGGKYLTIEEVDFISPEEVDFKYAYARDFDPENEIITGAYGRGNIRLMRGFAGKWTLTHESMHFLEDAGIITANEIGLLSRHINNLGKQGKFETANKDAIGGAEDRANFLADALTKEPPKGFVGRVIARIQEFIDRLMNAFGKRTPEGIVRNIRTGKVYEREPSQTDTAAFRKWFGDSKVVDENGEPLVVYHGTDKIFDAFSDNVSAKRALWKDAKGFYFTKNPDDASAYSGFAPEGQRVIPVYLSIQNPLRVQRSDFAHQYIPPERAEELKAQGYDGIISGDFEEVVVFRPEQIKSAIGNRGTFSPADARIQYSVQKILSNKEGYKKADPSKETPQKDWSAEKNKGWIQNEADLFLKEMLYQVSPNVHKMGTLKKFLTSPEWYEHPVFSRIVRLFVRDRSELYHEYYGHLTSLEQPQMEEDTVGELARKLKHKGLNWHQKMTGQASKEYQDVLKIIDEADIDNVVYSERNLKRQGYSDDTITVWKAFRESYDKALDLMTAQMRAMIEQIEEEAAFKGISPADFSDMYETLKGALATMGQLRGSYAPRTRQGNWAVTAYRGSGEDIEHYREHRFSHLAAQRLAKKLETEGWTIRNVAEVEKLSEDVYQDLKTVSVAKAIETAIENMSKGKGTETQNQSVRFNEEVLREVADMIRARGFRASMIRRKPGQNVVKGYIEDPIERHAIYTNNVARGLAKAKVAGKAMEELSGKRVKGEQTGGINPKAEAEIYSAAKDYIEEQLRNLDKTDRLIGWGKSLATLKFLGFSSRAALVNMTAIVTTTPASIHQYVGNGKLSMMKVHKALAIAGKDAARFMVGKDVGSADDMRFLTDEKRLGWDDPQYTRDMISRIGSTGNRAWAATMDGAMWMFGKTEQWNRLTTMLAAYRLARADGKNHAEASELAKTASDKAHGIYGRATLPSIAWGRNPAAKIAQMIYTFTKFSHNYLQLLHDLGFRKHNWSAFAYALLAPIVLSGVSAWPLKDQIFMPLLGIALSILGIKDKDKDMEKWLWDATRKHLGEGTERVGRYGALGALGLDVSGSLSIGVGIPKDFWEWGGAVGGVAKEGVTFAEELGKGNYGRAAEHLLPTGLANPFRAFREAEEGVTTKNKRRVWDQSGKPFVPLAGESVGRALGFRSTRQAALSERTWEGHRQQARFNEMRSDIYEQFRSWLLSGKRDRSTYGKILKEAREFNAKIAKLGLLAEVAPITTTSLRNQMNRMGKPSKRERAILM